MHPGYTVNLRGYVVGCRTVRCNQGSGLVFGQKEKVRSGGTLIFHSRLSTRNLYAPGKVDSCNDHRHPGRNPIEPPGFVLSAPGRCPCCCNEIERKNTTEGRYQLPIS